jgi:aspartate racemase
MRTIQPEGPYLLAGVSLGGIVAFEIAHQLTAQGQTVSFLALLDTWLMGATHATPITSQIAGHWRQFSQQGVSYILEKLYARIAAKLYGMKAWWQDTSYKLNIAFCRVFNRPLSEDCQDFIYQMQNHAFAVGYVPKAYTGHATLFKSTDAKGTVGIYVDPTLGWRQLVENLSIYTMSGTHLGMLEEPHVRVLGEQLHACIAESIQQKR